MMVGVREGEVLAGKFRVERVLGVGGMGVVVAARHIQLDERVALKFLLPEALASSNAVERFIREARAATKIKSEHVARVMDVGTFETGQPYIVMEYLDGVDLSQLLESQGPLPPNEVADLVLQACEVIAEAHALGIVHRDLKPANLFLTRFLDGSPCIKVLDFGISKVTLPGQDQAALTKTSAMMGSPLYMSPEQMSSARSVDARTDIWSLGAIMYELLTGGPPFSAESLPELCAKILQEEPPPVLTRRADVPAAFAAVVERCLTKSREQRYQTVGDLAVAMAEFSPQGGESVRRVTRMSRVTDSVPKPEPSMLASAPTLAQPAVAAPQQPASTGVAWGETKPGDKPRRGPLLIAAALFAATALVSAGGLGLWRFRSVQAEPAAQPSTVAVMDSAPLPEAPPAEEPPTSTSGPTPETSTSAPSASAELAPPARDAGAAQATAPSVRTKPKPKVEAPPPEPKAAPKPPTPPAVEPKTPADKPGKQLGGRT